MKSPAFSTHSRRTFLKYLAGSPYVAALGGIRAFAERAPEIAEVMADPKEALNVMDFEEATRRKVDPVHWAYLASGVDDDATLRANREGFQRIQLRPRRLRDASKVDLRTDLFGTVYNSPIFTCPASGEKFLDPDGELAVARATKARGTMQMLSTSTSTAVEDVNSAHGRPVWYQLYAPSAWEACEKLVRRVEAARCPVIALTVDHNAGRNSETYLRALPKGVRQCLTCHTDGLGPTVKGRKMYDGINMTGVAMQNPSMTWEFVDRLRKATPLKLFIKGNRYAGGRAPRGRAWHGRDFGFQSRRQVYRNRTIDHRGATRNCERGARSNSGVFGRRCPPGNGRVQGAHARSQRSGNRPPLPVGIGSVRPSRRRTGARDSSRRAPACDGKLRHANSRSH